MNIQPHNLEDIYLSNQQLFLSESQYPMETQTNTLELQYPIETPANISESQEDSIEMLANTLKLQLNPDELKRVLDLLPEESSLLNMGDEVQVQQPSQLHLTESQICISDSQIFPSEDNKQHGMFESEQLIINQGNNIKERQLSQRVCQQLPQKILPQVSHQQLQQQISPKLPQQQVPQQISPKLPQQQPQQLPPQLLQQTTQQLSQPFPQQLSQRPSQKLSQNLSQQKLQQLPPQLLQQTSQQLSQPFPQQLSEQLSQRPSQKLSQQFPINLQQYQYEWQPYQCEVPQQNKMFQTGTFISKQDLSDPQDYHYQFSQHDVLPQQRQMTMDHGSIARNSMQGMPCMEQPNSDTTETSSPEEIR